MDEQLQENSGLLGSYEVELKALGSEHHTVGGVLYCCVMSVINSSVDNSTEPETTKNEHEPAPLSHMYSSEGKFIQLPLEGSHGLFKALVQSVTTGPNDGEASGEQVITTEAGNEHQMQLARWNAGRTPPNPEGDSYAGRDLFSVAESGQRGDKASRLSSNSIHACEAGMLAFIEHALIRGQYARLLESGEFPVKPEMTATERGIKETELLTFTSLSPADLYRNNQMQELANMLEAHKKELPNFTGSLKAGHGEEGSILKRRYFRQLSALAFAQMLAAERLRECVVLRQYYPLTDNLLYALHWQPPERRMNRDIWEVETAPLVITQPALSAVDGEPSAASWGSVRSKGSKGSKLSKKSKASSKASKRGSKHGGAHNNDEDDDEPKAQRCAVETVTLTPAGDSLVLIKRFPPRTTDAAAAGSQSSPASKRLSRTPSEDGSAAASPKEATAAARAGAGGGSGAGVAVANVPWMSIYLRGCTLGLRAEPYFPSAGGGGGGEEDGALMHGSASAASLGTPTEKMSRNGSVKSGVGSRRSRDGDAADADGDAGAGTMQLNGVFFCHTQDDVRISAYSGPSPPAGQIRKPDGLGTCCLTTAFPDGLAVTLCSNGIIKYALPPNIAAEPPPEPGPAGAGSQSYVAGSQAEGLPAGDRDDEVKGGDGGANLPPRDEGYLQPEVLLGQEETDLGLMEGADGADDQQEAYGQGAAASLSSAADAHPVESKPKEYARYLGAGGTVMRLLRLPVVDTSSAHHHYPRRRERPQLPVSREILEPDGSRTLLLDADAMAHAFHYYQRRRERRIRRGQASEGEEPEVVDFNSLVEVDRLLLEHAPEGCISVYLGGDGSVVYTYPATAESAAAADAGPQVGLDDDDDLKEFKREEGVGEDEAEDEQAAQQSLKQYSPSISQSASKSRLPHHQQQQQSPHPLLHLQLIRSSVTDAESGSTVNTMQDGRLITYHSDGRREVAFTDGTSILTHASGNVVSVFCAGLPTMEMDVEVDTVSRAHARGAEVPINKSGERVRARVALPDGSAAMIKYDTKLTTTTNGSLKLVRRDRSVVVVKDDGVASYLPSSLWDEQAAAAFVKECEDGEFDPANSTAVGGGVSREAGGGETRVAFGEAQSTTVHATDASNVLVINNSETVAAPSAASAASAAAQIAARIATNVQAVASSSRRDSGLNTGRKSGKSSRRGSNSGAGGMGAVQGVSGTGTGTGTPAAALSRMNSARAGGAAAGVEGAILTSNSRPGSPEERLKGSGRKSAREQGGGGAGGETAVGLKGILRNSARGRPGDQPGGGGESAEKEQQSEPEPEPKMEQDATFTVNFGKLTCTIMDREYNRFDIDLSGQQHGGGNGNDSSATGSVGGGNALSPRVTLSGEVEGLKPSAVTDKPMEPRLFIVDRSAEATELLSNHDVKNMLASLKLYSEGDVLRYDAPVPAQSTRPRAVANADGVDEEQKAQQQAYFTRLFFRRRLFGPRCRDGFEFTQVFGPRLWFPKQRRTPAAAMLAARTNPFMQDFIREESVASPPRLYEETSLLQLPPLSKDGHTELRQAIQRCDEFREARLRSLDRFAVDEDRSEEELKETEVLAKRLKLAYKAAKVSVAKRKEQREKQRLASIASVGSVTTEPETSEDESSAITGSSAGKAGKAGKAERTGKTDTTTTTLLRKGSAIPEGAHEDEDEEDEDGDEDAASYDPAADGDEEEEKELSPEEQELRDTFDDFAALHVTQGWTGAPQSDYLLPKDALQDALIRLRNHHVSAKQIDIYIRRCEDLDFNMHDFTYGEFRALYKSIVSAEEEAAREQLEREALRSRGSRGSDNYEQYFLGAPSEDSLASHATFGSPPVSSKSPMFWQSQRGKQTIGHIPPAAPPLDFRRLDWAEQVGQAGHGPEQAGDEPEPLAARRGSTEYQPPTAGLEGNRIDFYNNASKVEYVSASADDFDQGQRMVHAATVGGIHPYGLSSDSLDNPEFDPNLPTNSAKYPAGSALQAARKQQYPAGAQQRMSTAPK